MRHTVPMLGCLILVGLVGTAHAKAPEASTEERGLFVRVGVGPRLGASFAEGRADGGFSTPGFAVGFGMAIGYTQTPSFSVHGDVSFVRLLGRKTNVEHTSDPVLDRLSDTLDYTMLNMGLGATWHHRPTESFVSLSVGFGRLGVTDDGVFARRPDTAIGVAGELLAGKNWPVEKHLWVGVAGAVSIASLGDRSATWQLTTVGLQVTLTYN